MGILPGGKSKEEKIREQRLEQDSLQVSKAESRMMAEDKEEKDNARNQLLDPEEDKKQLKKLLLNKKLVEVPQYHFYCKNCGSAYNKEPEECENCEEEEFVPQKADEPGYRWVDRSQDSLLNNEGFNKIVWPEVEPAISGTVAGGYLKGREISKINYSTLSTITTQFSLYPWRYGVENPSDMQQIGDIIRPPLIAHSSKARGGRGLESTEKTVMEKISRAVKGDSDDEDNGGMIF